MSCNTRVNAGDGNTPKDKTLSLKWKYGRLSDYHESVPAGVATCTCRKIMGLTATQELAHWVNSHLLERILGYAFLGQTPDTDSRWDDIVSNQAICVKVAGIFTVLVSSSARTKRPMFLLWTNIFALLRFLLVCSDWKPQFFVNKCVKK